MNPICWVVKTAVPGGSGRWCAATGGCMRGFLLMHWKKKQGLKLSVVLYLHIYGVRGLFFIQIVIWLKHRHKQIQMNLCCGPWPEIWLITLFGHNALVMRYIWVFFWVAWNKKRTEKERDEMVLEPGQKMKILYDQQSVNNVRYSQQDTLKG